MHTSPPSRVLITGAAGFVGANLIMSLLEEGVEVQALVRKATDLYRIQGVKNEIQLIDGNLADSEVIHRIFREARPQAVIHCAFPIGYPADVPGREAMLHTGLLGTYHLLLAARDSGVDKFISIGSSTEYGNRAEPCREEDMLDPLTIRGVAKAASTQLCRQFALEYGFPVSILRLYSVFGPWEKTSRLIPTACFSAISGKPMNLTPPGYSHDFVYIVDVIRACRQVLNLDLAPGEIINIGSGRSHTNEQVVEMVERLSGTMIQKIVGAYPLKILDHPNWVADITRAGERLGWQPSYTLEQGLRETFEWWCGRQAGTG
jgi:nucleoside-diphosphate-sugar epimerase